MQSLLHVSNAMLWRRSVPQRLLRPGAIAASTLFPPNNLSLHQPQRQQLQYREKHSSTQIKRLFKQNPARLRVHGRLGVLPTDVKPPPEPTFTPVVEKVEIFPNGWTPPPPANLTLPNYPFAVQRTKNKPYDAVGFLPVYSKMRKDGTLTTTRIKKVSGDQDAFLHELRAALQLPYPASAEDDKNIIRVRTGGTIEIKGNYVRQVRAWLAGLGF